MIVKMPNLDPDAMGELASYIEAVATQYMYRVDGSSLWEGNARDADELPSDLGEWLPTMPPSNRVRHYWESVISYPVFEVPSGFRDLNPEQPGTSIRFYANDQLRAVIGRQDHTVLIAQHPTDATYRWELERIRDSTSFPTSPRGIFTAIRPVGRA